MKKLCVMLRPVYRPVALLFCLGVLALPLYAQNNKATIVGTVKDPSNAILVGSKLTATKLAPNETTEPVTTAHDGRDKNPNHVAGNSR